MRFRAVVIAVVHQSGNVLVLNGPNGLVLPGGSVEPGEEPIDAAVRELREETGCAVESESLLPLFCADGVGYSAAPNAAVAPPEQPQDLWPEGRPGWTRPQQLLALGVRYRRTNRTVVAALALNSPLLRPHS